MKGAKKDRAASFLPPHRIEALTDGVFAIVMTLLVLEFSIPIIAENRVNAELPQALLELLPSLYSYGLSFLVLGMIWTGHRTIFHLIKHSDGTLVFLNTFFLMFVALVPFTTSLLGDYFLEQIPIAVYGANIVLIFTMRLLISIYAFRRYRLVDSDADSRIAREDKMIQLIALVAMLGNIGIAFVSAIAATVIFYLILMYFIVVIIRARIPTFRWFGKSELK
jgi:uncharacterized membrane protein